MTKEVVRIIAQYACQSLGDSAANRASHELALREKGCTVFRHLTSYQIQNDELMLRTDGFIVEPTQPQKHADANAPAT